MFRVEGTRFGVWGLRAGTNARVCTPVKKCESFGFRWERCAHQGLGFGGLRFRFWELVRAHTSTKMFDYQYWTVK